MDKETAPIYCAYCEYETPADAGALARIQEHVAACPHHPQRKVERELEAAVGHADALIRQRNAVRTERDALARRAAVLEATLRRTEDDLQRMEIAQADGRELLREALDGLEVLVTDPRDPAIRRLLRRMRAATATGMPSDAPGLATDGPGADSGVPIPDAVDGGP